MWKVQEIIQMAATFIYAVTDLGGAERFRPRINDTVLKTQVAMEKCYESTSKRTLAAPIAMKFTQT